MKQSLRPALVGLAALLAPSCVEDVGMFYNDNDIIVIDAIFSTDDSLHRVNIYKGGNGPGSGGSVEVKLGTLTDDLGHVDTLGIVERPEVNDFVWGNFNVWSLYQRYGFYGLRKYDMSAGRTYTLDIELADGRRFVSTQTLRCRPEVQSIRFYEFDFGMSVFEECIDDVCRECKLRPLFFLQDSSPGEDDYYMIHDGSYGRNGQRGYPVVMLISDRQLRPEVGGVSFNYGLGAGNDNYNSIWFPHCVGSSYRYTVSSISREVYDYYTALETQITNDGGNYQPTPASPRSNFSGDNVQGLFIVADSYSVSGVVQEDMLVK